MGCLMSSVNLSVLMGEHAGEVHEGPSHIGGVMETGSESNSFNGQVGFDQ